MGRGRRGFRDHNSSFLSPANTVVDGNSKTRQMVQREKRQEGRKARSVAQGVLKAVRRHAKVWTTGDEPHVAAAQWRSATSSAGVYKNGSQSCMISETRCRAKLYGIFKQAERHSKNGPFWLLLGRSDQLVGSQIARLSSFGIVILSEVLSHGFDLNSYIVRNVLPRVFSKHVIKRMLLVSARRSAVTRLVSLSCVGPPRALSFSKWPLAYPSRNVLRCFCALAADSTM